MPTQREEDEAKIRQQVDKIVEGIRAKDLEGLKRLYTTDVVSFDVEPPLQHVGREAKLKNWAKAFTFFQDVDYEVRDLTVTVGDDVAFGHAFGRLSGTLKDGFCAVRYGKRQGSDRPSALTRRRSTRARPPIAPELTVAATPPAAPAKPTNAGMPTPRQHHDHNELQLPTRQDIGRRRLAV
jgi:ketosteroid isomerase-like protein